MRTTNCCQLNEAVPATREGRIFQALAQAALILENSTLKEAQADNSAFLIERQTTPCGQPVLTYAGAGDRITISYMDGGEWNAYAEGNLPKQRLSLTFSQRGMRVDMATYPEKKLLMEKFEQEVKAARLSSFTPLQWAQLLTKWGETISGRAQERVYLGIV